MSSSVSNHHEVTKKHEETRRTKQYSLLRDLRGSSLLRDEPADCGGCDPQLAVSPGFNSSTFTPCGWTSSRSCAGVPVTAGNVPKCIGTTCRTPSSSQALAACSGPIVNRSPIGRNAIAG